MLFGYLIPEFRLGGVFFRGIAGEVQHELDMRVSLYNVQETKSDRASSEDN